MADQTTDSDVGGGGNMTFKTTSKSPTQTGEGVAWRDWTDGSEDDNNGYGDRPQVVIRNEG